MESDRVGLLDQLTAIAIEKFQQGAPDPFTASAQAIEQTRLTLRTIYNKIKVDFEVPDQYVERLGYAYDEDSGEIRWQDRTEAAVIYWMEKHDSNLWEETNRRLGKEQNYGQ